MEQQYSFHEGTVPSGYLPEFEESIFNSEPHRKIQSSAGWHSFHVLNDKNKKISASVHFHVLAEEARSPFKSPYGSIEFSDTLPPETLFEFIKFLELSLRKKSVSKIIIKNYPQVYCNDRSILLETFLINLGFKIINAEISSYIKIDSGEPADLFHRSGRIKLEKAQQEGLSFKQFKIEDLKVVYSFIDQCQKAKGYTLSMKYDDLRQTADLFPDRYLLFGVMKDEKLISAAIAIRVKENILYEFYHDHDASFDHISPVAMLVAQLCDFCDRSGISILDLGTSAIDNAPNFGLLQFKKFLGGKPSPKFTFEKTF